MAFIRSARGGQAFGRLYLITFAQFDQLIQQEQGAKRPLDTPICPPLSYITGNEFCFTNPANPTTPVDPKMRLSYGRILNLGWEDHHPILTFTAVGPDNDITPAEPSREYLQTIARGIGETFPEVLAKQICEYFSECDGVRDNVLTDELSRWLFEKGSGEMDFPTDRNKYRYDACVKALQFELEQFWKRSLFFWGFIGAAFVAFASSESHPSFQVAIASFGFVCSVVWTLVNRGSKFWYEDWEDKLKEAEIPVTGRLYGSPGSEKKVTDKWYSVEGFGKRLWKGKRYSPSKLAVALSDYIAILWFCVLAYKFWLVLQGIHVTGWRPVSKGVFVVLFVGLSFVFAVLLGWFCHTSKD